MGKKGKNILPTRLIEKKILDDQKSPPPNPPPPSPPQELNGRLLMKGAKITFENNGAQYFMLEAP